ncbi:MAG: PAC2 family protein [Candidatus Woesearchaeota archaeon]
MPQKSNHVDFSNIELVKVAKEKIKPKKALLIVGFPGIGNVSKLAANYIIDNLKLKRIYEIKSIDFPFLVIVDENDVPKEPTWEIYGGKIKHKYFDYIYVFTGDFVLEDTKTNNLMIKFLENEFKRLNVKEIISFAGIATESPKEKLYVLSNDKNKTKLIKKELNLDSELYGFVGYISGMNGAFLKTSITTVCFLIETYAIPYYQGITETKLLIEAINKSYKLKISVKDLEENIQNIKKKIEEINKAETTKIEKTINYIG